MPEYPGHSNPCNGCGICCIAEQCPVSVKQFGVAQVCPALQFEDGRFWCGLMKDPLTLGADMDGLLEGFDNEVVALAYRQWIGGDKGCDSENDGEVVLEVAA
jgi:hypothetical protein